jgi:hypothetical protein
MNWETRHLRRSPVEFCFISAARHNNGVLVMDLITRQTNMTCDVIIFRYLKNDP